MYASDVSLNLIKEHKKHTRFKIRSKACAVNSIKEQSTPVARMKGWYSKMSEMTSVKFPHTMLFSGSEIHTVVQCLRSLKVVNVWLHKILATNIQYSGDTKTGLIISPSKSRDHGQLHFQIYTIAGDGRVWLLHSSLFFWEQRTILFSLFVWILTICRQRNTQIHQGGTEGREEVNGHRLHCLIFLCHLLEPTWWKGEFESLYNDRPDSKLPEATGITQTGYNGIFRLTQFSMPCFNAITWATSPLFAVLPFLIPLSLCDYHSVV